LSETFFSFFSVWLPKREARLLVINEGSGSGILSNVLEPHHFYIDPAGPGSLSTVRANLLTTQVNMRFDTILTF
jgi:hypothetical protein